MYCCFIAFLLLTAYFTLWPWPLTVDLEYLLCITCGVMKLCAEFERNRTICGGVVAIWIFDLMTLNMSRVPQYSGINWTEFKLSQPIRAWNVTIFDANTLCNAVTLTFDGLTLNMCDTLAVAWTHSVRNLSKIEQSAAELLMMKKPFPRFCEGPKYRGELVQMGVDRTLTRLGLHMWRVRVRVGLGLGLWRWTD